ncbi:MAG: pentapeptide repeat-containing protein [Chloroflexota bacterium]
MTGYYSVSAPVNAEDQSSSEPDDSDYFDFDLEIKPSDNHQYPVSVLNSPAGEATHMMNWPYTDEELDHALLEVEQTLLHFGGQRRGRLSENEAAVQNLGANLFDALFAGEIRNLYDVSRERALQNGRGLRIKLRVTDPCLASLPWEYLYDRRHDRYLALSSRTPLVRYLESQLPPRPLITSVPLRILGMAPSPKDTTPLHIRREKQRVQTALHDLIEDGRIELKWIEGGSWRDLQRELLQGPWHVFHFIGHGFFHSTEDEGYVIFADEEGMSDALGATKLAHLLADHPALRLVLLNTCEGAKGGKNDTLSSTASILIKHGVPSVLAMQYEISNAAAVECARSFYQAVAYGLPVDAAAAEARKGMAVHARRSPEWGVPVLYMRSKNGRLFHFKAKQLAKAREVEPISTKEQGDDPTSNPQSRSSMQDHSMLQPPHLAGTVPRDLDLANEGLRNSDSGQPGAGDSGIGESGAGDSDAGGFGLEHSDAEHFDLTNFDLAHLNPSPAIRNQQAAEKPGREVPIPKRSVAPLPPKKQSKRIWPDIVGTKAAKHKQETKRVAKRKIEVPKLSLPARFSEAGTIHIRKPWMRLQIWIVIALLLGIGGASTTVWAINLYIPKLFRTLVDGPLTLWVGDMALGQWKSGLLLPMTWGLMGLIWWFLLQGRLSRLGQFVITIPLTWTLAWIVGLTLSNSLAEIGLTEFALPESKLAGLGPVLTMVDQAELGLSGTAPLDGSPQLSSWAWWQSRGWLALPWALSGAAMTGTSFFLIGLSRLRFSRGDSTEITFWKSLLMGSGPLLSMFLSHGLEGWAFLLRPVDHIGLAGNLAGAATAIQLGYGIYVVRMGLLHPSILSLGIICWSVLSSFLPQMLLWIGEWLNQTWLTSIWATLGGGMMLTLAPTMLWLTFFERAALFRQLTFQTIIHAHQALSLIRQRGQWNGESAEDYLTFCNLAKLPLAEEILEDFDLRGVSFQNALLNDSQLIDCDLQRASFLGAKLSNASLAGSDLSGASLANAQVDGLLLTHSLYDSQTVWPDGFEVQNRRAIGPRAMLKGEILSGFQLDEADLQEANLEQADLSHASLIGANLKGANLSGTDFKGADLTDANLLGVILANARYDEKTCWPNGFCAEEQGAVLVTVQS